MVLVHHVLLLIRCTRKDKVRHEILVFLGQHQIRLYLGGRVPIKHIPLIAGEALRYS